MRTQATDSLSAWPADLVPPRGVLVLSGYGLDIRVWRGRLRVADGIGHDRREGLVHRATGRLKRLVVLGHTGTVSLEAIRWLADVGAGYVQIDADGRVLAAFGPLGSDRPGLRRAQARALDTPIGNDIARRLIAEKIAAQAETLVEVDRIMPVAPHVIEALRTAAAAVHISVERDDLRVAEAAAAAAYWSAWAEVPVRFGRRDAGRSPEHWRSFGTRTSPLTGSPRLASNPANALLNYLYALLESEATLAARVVGLDPGLGLMHADQLNRDSLATDLMEPVRPVIDRVVLGLLMNRTFALSDFYETRQGVCRVTPPLARKLAITAGDWRMAVGRVAEDIARLLLEDGASERPAPTPLTGRNRSQGRGARAKRRVPSVGTSVRRTCIWCGQPVAQGRRTCSAECADAVAIDDLPGFVTAGRVSLERLREVGFQPELSAAGRRRIGSRATVLLQEAREWQRTHPWPDLEAFGQEILPGLLGVPARALAEATGLSVGYCRRVLSGTVTPHPMWWEAMRALAGKSGVSGVR